MRKPVVLAGMQIIAKLSEAVKDAQVGGGVTGVAELAFSQNLPQL